MKKNLLCSALLLLTTCSSIYPLKNTTSGALVGISCAAYFKAHSILQTWLDDDPYMSQEDLYFIKTLDVVAFIIGVSIFPTYFLGKLPKARLIKTRKAINTIKNQKILKQHFATQNGFYEYIFQEYSNYNWPLIASKEELNIYHDCIEANKKVIKKAINDTKKQGPLWQSLYSTWHELETLRKKLVILLDYINNHPDYSKFIKESSEINAANCLAFAHLLNAFALL